MVPDPLICGFENEFSLMACAMVKAQTEDGRYRYPLQRVYAWLDDIRAMSLNQTFAANTEPNLEMLRSSDHRVIRIIN